MRNAGYQVFAAQDASARPISILPRDPRHSVIFLTVSKNASERAKQLGAGHLTKPLMADELLRAVEQHARR